MEDKTEEISAGHLVRCITDGYERAPKEFKEILKDGYPNKDALYTVRKVKDDGSILLEEIVNPTHESCGGEEPSFPAKNFKIEKR
jgi:hypothetical protein